MQQVIIAAIFLLNPYHFLQRHFYDPETFMAVIGLCILQTFVGVDSGFLALKSLEKLSPFWRRVQIGLIIGSGSFIILVTLGIGYLADQGEKKVDLPHLSSAGQRLALFLS